MAGIFWIWNNARLRVSSCHDYDRISRKHEVVEVLKIEPFLGSIYRVEVIERAYVSETKIKYGTSSAALRTPIIADITILSLI